MPSLGLWLIANRRRDGVAEANEVDVGLFKQCRDVGRSGETCVAPRPEISWWTVRAEEGSTGLKWKQLTIQLEKSGDWRVEPLAVEPVS